VEWIRNGDVILTKVSEIKGKQVMKQEEILAEGEVTGHFHRLQSKQMLVSEQDGQRFVELKEDGKLTHQEHDTLIIPSGKYQVLIQREVDLLGEVRQVMD